MKRLEIADINRLRIPVLIITVTDKETKAFMDKFTYLNGEETIFVAKHQTYSIGYIGKYMVAHVKSNMGAGRADGAQLTVYDGISDIAPRIILMVGIAFGINSKNQKIGDILVSEKVFPYELVKISTSTNEQIRINRNKAVAPAQDIINVFKSFNLDGYSVFTGTLLSGEKLIDNVDFRNSLIKLTNDSNVIGGEMESCGLAHAAQRKGATNWVVVKSICDFADGNKSDNKNNNQNIAAYNAMEYCCKVFDSDILKTNLNIPQINRKFLNKTRLPINGYLLFYYRNLKRVSFRKLSNSLKIKETTLRQYEKISINDDGTKFNYAYEDDIKKLEKFFKCQGKLSVIKTDKSKIEFYKNKGKKQFFPVSNYKAVFFDFDGTLTKKRCDRSTWQLLWKELGYPDSECTSLHRKYINKEIKHPEWCNITKNKFIEKNLTESIVKECSKQIELVPNVFETIRILKKEGIKCYIVSGSINTVINHVLGSNKSLFDGIECNKFFYNDDGQLEEIVGTDFDFEGKAKYIKSISEKFGIMPNEMLFIGNSNNDEFAYKSGANTLVINPKLTNAYNKKTWHYIINELNDYYDILPFVLPEKYNTENIIELRSNQQNPN